MELDHIPTLQLFNTCIWHQSRQHITNECLQLFHSLNTDVFYSIQTWPTHIQQLFWKKPTRDNDSFQLTLFFIGNDCPPELVAKWVLPLNIGLHIPKEKREQGKLISLC